MDGQGEVLKRSSFEHLSIISNPKIAPYGAASEETMKALGVYEVLRPKLVEGRNVTQAYPFVASGAAELTFVALFQLFRNEEIQGSGWIVPAKLNPVIRQDAVLLIKGKNKPGSSETAISQTCLRPGNDPLLPLRNLSAARRDFEALGPRADLSS